MTAWQLLIAKSSFAVGTAWQHLSSVISSGGGLVINDGVYLDYQDMTIQTELEDAGISLALSDNEVLAEIADTQIQVEVCE